MLFFVLDTYYLSVMTLVGLYALTLTGFIIFTGYTGQILLCQGTLMAFGGYSAAILSAKDPLPPVVGYGLPPIVGMGVGVLLAIAFTYVIGRIILRLRLWYLALATIAIAVISESVLDGWVEVTGGTTGVIGIPPFSLGGLVFDSTESFYILAWVVALGGWVFALHLLNSRPGRAFGAISRDEVAASTLGIDVTKYKVQAFMLCGAYAAVSGGLYVHFIGSASPDAFNLMVSFKILMAAILGGLGTIYSVFLSAPIMKFLPDMLAIFGDYKPMIFGLFFIIIPMYFAGGITGMITTIRRKLSKFISTRG